MKFDLNIISHKAKDNYSVLPLEDSRNYIYIVSNNQTLANEVYNEIITSYDLKKNFTTEDFNEVTDHLSSESKLQLRKADFLLVVYNAAGCFIAQSGKTRAIQVRPDEQEIVFDSRNLVLDIYSSKTKVNQLNDYKEGDIILLSSAENIDASSVKRVLVNPALSFSDKADKLKDLKELTNSSYILVDANNVESTFSFDALKKIKFKYIGYFLLVCAIAAVVAWAIANNPLKGADDGAVVDEDTIVTVNSNNNAEIIVKEQPADTSQTEKTEKDDSEDGAEKKTKKKKDHDKEADEKKSSDNESGVEENSEKKSDKEAKKKSEDNSSEKKTEKKPEQKDAPKAEPENIPNEG